MNARLTRRSARIQRVLARLGGTGGLERIMTGFFRGVTILFMGLTVMAAGAVVILYG